jgi:hypothetical protein
MRFLHLLFSLSLCTVFAFCLHRSASAEDAVLFTEDFSNSNSNLNWLPFPGFNDDTLLPILDPTTPQGDLWAGRQTNTQLGGFAAMSYAGMANLTDYTIEAWVYTTVVPVEKPPLNGLAVRVDPENQQFYRLASHFGADRRLTFAYVGSDSNNFPIFLGSWKQEDILGGLPAESSWHKMAIKCTGNRFWVYWDDQELPGCPIEDERIGHGFFGVYANYVGAKGIIETRVDAIRVKTESKPAEPAKASGNPGGGD